MRSSLLVRAGSVAAAAAIATTGAMATAGAAGAATTHPRLATHLSIAKRRAILHHMHAVVIAGLLRSHKVPLRNEVVFLERRTAGTAWVVAGRERTHRLGGVAFVVTPKVNAQFVLVFKGTRNFRPTHSRVINVKAGA
jgi:hypothetical protein